VMEPASGAAAESDRESAAALEEDAGPSEA